MTEQTTESVEHVDTLLDTPEAEAPETGAESEAPSTKEEQTEKPRVESVPHAALHEERTRRKELERKLTEEASNRTKLEERVNQLTGLFARGQQEEEQMDPLELLARQVGEVTKTVNEKLTAEQQAQKQQADEREFIQKYLASAQAYLKDNPAFGDAYGFLTEARSKELQKIYRDPAKVMEKLLKEEREIVEQAYADERNPAEVLFELAQERGYKQQAKTETPKLETMDRGLKAAKSLGSGGGKVDSNFALDSISARDLADMSDEEFTRLFKDAEKRASRR